MSRIVAYDKIKKLEELAGILEGLRGQGKTVALCHGVFDLIHPGHIKHFEAASKCADVLVVTLTEDKYVGKGPGRPVFNQRLRAETIAEIGCVDFVAINCWPTSVETIKLLKPDFYVKGSDYAKREDDLTGEIYREEEAVRAHGGKIHFTDEITFSSTELLNIHFNVYHQEADEFLKEFRKKYNAEEVIALMNSLKKMKVMVVGDTIIDEYHYCQPMGKAWKETVIATRYINRESFAGGVLACANHIGGFCDNVHLVTCLGDENSREDFILSHLKKTVSPQFFYRSDAPTVVKRRYVDHAFLSKIFEVCFLDTKTPPREVNQKVCSYLEENCPRYDLVIAADFGNGFISPEMVEVLCAKSKFLAVMTQTNSANCGFNLIGRYPRADYVCIDEPEIRLAMHDKFGELEEMMLQVARNLRAGRVTITGGHRGSYGYTADEGFVQVPVFSKEVVDRIGAGDAYLAITSACVAAGFPMDLVGFIGNAVGALAVKIVCNRESVEPVPLYKFITALLK
ncbi:MAG TPA: PfkB family carbohydrate kinase [bacterium]|nr:PfkB family carbohydrate kinase [bacterium]